MSTPILTTKLHIPLVREALTSRPRLLERLNTGLWLSHGFTRKLTLVSAPAGFGKTTLVSHWIAHNRSQISDNRLYEQGPRIVPQPYSITNLNFCWLSLDKGDNDPLRFLAYLIAALQTIQNSLGEGLLGMLHSPQPPPTETLLTGLLNEITEIPQPFVLILDDYHAINDERVQKMLVFLLDNLPPRMHLVIISRADPPWPLARLRARGEMIELRTRDLRFTTDEAASFLNDVMELGLSPGDISELEGRTEGWIAGLKMAALAMQSRLAQSRLPQTQLSMRGHKDLSIFIKAFAGSHRFILDYLVEEVLTQQTPEVQEFLAKTSILERMNASLCNAVTGRGDSAEILSQLDQANLFLVTLDDERRWYRYHHLFADLLRGRLQQTQSDQTPGLHRLASEWYEQNGLVAEAVGHSFAAGDLKRVASLIEGNASAMLDHGELNTLVDWLNELPRELVCSRPWLCLAYAWALALTGQFEATERLLQDADKSLAGFDDLEPSEAKHVAGHKDTILSYIICLGGDWVRAAEMAQGAMERLPEEDLMARGFAATTLGVSLRQKGDLAAAEKAFVDAITINQRADNYHIAMTALCDLSFLQRFQGRLHECLATCRRALHLADEFFQRSGWQLPVTGNAYGRMSLVFYEWNDLQAAIDYASKGVKLSKQGGLAEVTTDCLFQEATARQAIGDSEGSRNAILEAKKIAADLSNWYLSMAEAIEARLLLAQDDYSLAAQWADREMSFKYDSAYQYRIHYPSLARVRISQGRPDEALSVLARLLEATEAAGAMHYVIESLVLMAIAHQAKGETDQALDTLERALTLGKPEDYVRTFIDEGAPMGTLLRMAAARRGGTANIEPTNEIVVTADAVKDYANTLLKALEKDTRDDGHADLQGQGKPMPTIALVEPLSEREIEVLRLLNTSLSSTEIAAELYISVSTVRTHIKNIYSKLNVHRRIEAVERGKELGLL